MSVYTIFWLVLFGLVYFLPIGIAILVNNLVDNLVQNLFQKEKTHKDEPEEIQSLNGNLEENKNKRNQKNLKQTNKIWQKSWVLGLANCVILAAYFIFHKNIWNLSWANFGLHFAGGVACGLIFEYFLAISTSFLKKILSNFDLDFISHFDKLNFGSNFLSQFLFQFILLYFLVSGFGVGNELLEFLLDKIGNLPFSTDRFDTWFDLTANTLGAITIWILIFVGKVLFGQNISKKYSKNIEKA